MCSIITESMAEVEFSEEQCSKIISRYLKNKNVTLISSSMKPLSNQLDGFLGQQFFLTITYKDQTDNVNNFCVFVKMINKNNPVMIKLSQELQAFEKETFFYEEFVPKLRKYGLACDYAAESYFGDSSIIVLEDLSKTYRGIGKENYLNLEYCKVCLKTIARFHADGFLYQCLKSKEVSKEYKLSDEYSKILEDTIANRNNVTIRSYFFYSVKGIIEIVKLLPENGTNVEDFINSLLAVMDSDIESLTTNFRLTIGHNDLWANNFLYNFDENGDIKSCKIIDYQTINLKPPAADVLSFLMLNTRKKFRDQHLSQLLAYYYKCLSDFIKDECFNPNEILSEEEFRKSCEIQILPAKLHATIDRSLTQIPEEVYLEANTIDGLNIHFIHEGRPKYMVKSFKKYENYRDILTEDIYELRSLVLQNC